MELSWKKGACFPMKISESLSRQLATVTFVATVLVVMCHCDDVMSNKNGIVRFLGGIFTDANVANFFFLSGFFVARHYKEDRWYRKAIIGRLRTLGVPYLAWCLIYLCIYGCATMVGACHPQAGLFDVHRVFGIGLLTQPIDFALWYIKTLFYFIIVSPLFFGLQNRYRIAFPGMAVTLLLFKISPLGSSPMFGFCFNIVGFICFLLGGEMVFRNEVRSMFLCDDKRSWRKGGVPLILWISCALCVNYLEGTSRSVVHPLYVLFAVYCLQRTIACIPFRIGETFVKASFLIYASHLIILTLVSPLINKFFGGVPVLCFSILVAVPVLGGVVLMIALRNISRTTLALLTGGRG